MLFIINMKIGNVKKMKVLWIKHYIQSSFSFFFFVYKLSFFVVPCKNIQNLKSLQDKCFIL